MDILDLLKANENKIAKISLSDTDLEAKKITIRPVLIKNITKWQITKTIGTKEFHSNVDFDDLLNLGYNDYNQVLVKTLGYTYQFIKHKDRYRLKTTANSISTLDTSHDKEKSIF